MPWRNWAAYGAAAATAGAVAIALLAPVPATFNVTVQSEHVEFFTDGAPVSRWPLDRVWLFEGDADSARPFTGSLEFADSVHVTVERVALGPLLIRVEAPRAGDPAAVLYDAADEPLGPVRAPLEIEVPDLARRSAAGQELLLPLTGRVRSGRSVGFETPGGAGLLRGGKAALLGRSLLERTPFLARLASGTVFEAGSVTLDAGDQFTVEGVESPAFGFIVVDERPALAAAYRVVGRSGRVERPGGQAYSVRVNLRARLVHDGPLQALYASFVMVMVGLGKLRGRWRRKNGAAPAGAAGLVLIGLALPARGGAQNVAQNVLIQGAGEGQGILRPYGNRCYVVAPLHVVENAISPIPLTGESGLRATATAEHEYAALDLAVLEVSQDPPFGCPGWEPPADLGSLLARAGPAVLRMREGDGSQTQLPVTVRNYGDERIFVAAGRAGDVIHQGMSGSLLIVDGTVAGLLVAVDSGEGIVQRIDVVERITYCVFHRCLADNPLADLTGDWRRLPGSGGFSIRRSGTGWTVTFAPAGGGGSDPMPETAARGGDRVFILQRSGAGPIHHGHDGETGEWTEEYTAEVLYYPVLDRHRAACPPQSRAGLAATVTYREADRLQTLTIRDVPYGTALARGEGCRFYRDPGLPSSIVLYRQMAR